jgi:hypothetical protein
MAPSVQIVLSGVLTFGVPMLFAARELIVLKRGGGSWRPDPTPAPVPRPRMPPSGALPQRPLPACLIPTRLPETPVARQVRVLDMV